MQPSSAHSSRWESGSVRDPRTLLARVAALSSDQRLPRELVDQLVDCLAAPAPELQRAAADELVRFAAIEPRIEARLNDRLDATDATMRRTAAFTLARLGARVTRLVPVLVEALGDARSEVRWSAHHALGLLGERGANAAAEALLAATRAPNATLRRMALYALRDWDMPPESSAEAVRTALADPDSDVRLAALAAASVTREVPERMVPAMLPLAEHDPRPGVRRAAAAALGKIARRDDAGAARDRVRGALERFARDSDPRLRKAARAALHSLDP